MRTELITLLVAVSLLFALHCSGSKDFRDEVATFADADSLDFTNEVTLSIRLYRRANSPANQGLIFKGRTEFSSPMLYGLYFTGGSLKFIYGNPAGTYFTYTSTSSFPQTNTPIHVAATYRYSIADSMRLYVNGEEAVGTWDSTPTVVGLVNSENLTWGAFNDAASGISGKISDVTIWNAYLTYTQIQSIYHGPKHTPLQFTQGLVAHWACDEGTEQEVSNSAYRLVDLTPTHAHSSGLGSGKIRSDGFVGYPPNE